MKIAVMGAGATGCYYGAALFRAGHDVRLVARGAHLRALQQDGLRLESPRLGNHHLRIPATGDPAAVGPADLVLFCVKSQDTEDAARRMAPLVGPGTAILSLQNGVENEDLLANLYGKERVLPGVCRISVTIRAPGHVVHMSDFHPIEFGAMEGPPGEREEQILAAMRAAGLEVSLVPDARKMLWDKFVMLACWAGVSTLTQAPIGEWRGCAETWAVFQAALHEAWQVGRALGVRQADDYVARTVAAVQGMAPHLKSSMQLDREKGRFLEVDALSGAVVRLGQKAGVPTPVHQVIHACLTLYNRQVSS